MRSYNCPVANALLSTTVVNTPWVLQSTANIRPLLQEFVFGPRQSADTIVNFAIARTITTAVVAGAALLENPTDESNTVAAAALGTSGATGTVYTTGPTAGAIMHPVGLHQRATYRWVAQPGREIQSAALATAGLYLLVAAVTAFNADFMGSWDE